MKLYRYRTQITNRGELCLIACDSGRPLAKRILKHLNTIIEKDSPGTKLTLVNSKEITFANGELKTIIKENIRGADVYIVQAVDDPQSNKSINDNLMALLTAINAAYQSDADSITAVCPQFPYSRQERKKTRESITAKQVACFFETSGADRVITLDIHSEAIQGFFNKTKLEDLHASTPLISFIKRKLNLKNLVVAGSDVGGAEKARYYSKRLHTSFAVVDKARDYSKQSVVESMRLVGDVSGMKIPAAKRLCGSLGLLEIALHHRVAADHDLAQALAVHGYLLHGLWIHRRDILHHRHEDTGARLDGIALFLGQIVPSFLP